MEPVRPAAARHEATGELVDDDHFAVFDDVVDIELVELVRPQSLVHGVKRVHVLWFVEVLDVEQLLGV